MCVCARVACLALERLLLRLVLRAARVVEPLGDGAEARQEARLGGRLGLAQPEEAVVLGDHAPRAFRRRVRVQLVHLVHLARLCLRTLAGTLAHEYIAIHAHVRARTRCAALERRCSAACETDKQTL